MITDQISNLEGQLSGPKAFVQQLEYFASGRYTGQLNLQSNTVNWSIDFCDGKVFYASVSVDPVDRLDRHLRKLSQTVPALTKDVRASVRQDIDQTNGAKEETSPDYRAILSLVERQILSVEQASTLVNGLIQEVFESALLLQEGQYCFTPWSSHRPNFCQFDVMTTIQDCYKRLDRWKKLAPELWSPYQRPYFVSQATALDKLSAEKARKLGQVLRGFSFRHLSVLLNHDELTTARNIYPLIQNKMVLVRPPQAPFDLLPDLRSYIPENKENLVDSELHPEALNTEVIKTKTHTIACIDDSPSVLSTIQRYLENDSLNIVQINQPMRALTEIMKAKPDLILMDVGMPQIDGYAICRMLRKHSSFQETPIIMVTGNTGLIDRAKAKLVGATDYMTKPFTQEGLTKMVFRYLMD